MVECNKCNKWVAVLEFFVSNTVIPEIFFTLYFKFFWIEVLIFHGSC